MNPLTTSRVLTRHLHPHPRDLEHLSLSLHPTTVTISVPALPPLAPQTSLFNPRRSTHQPVVLITYLALY